MKFSIPKVSLLTSKQILELADLNQSINDLRTKSLSFFEKSSKAQNDLLRKVARYKGELQFVNTQLKSWQSFVPGTSPWDHYFVVLNEQRVKALEGEKKSLESLIKISIELLAGGDNPFLDYQLRSLEAERKSTYWIILNGIDRWEMTTVCEAKDYLQDEIKALTREHLKILLRRVRHLVGKIRSGLSLDRRERFRAIVHFIFKNMDDYDGEEYVLRAA